MGEREAGELGAGAGADSVSGAGHLTRAVRCLRPSVSEARPILFQGAMVRAILAGTKTQTRRAVKPRPDFDTARAMLGGDTDGATVVYDHAFGGIGLKRGNGIGFVQPNIRSPYGKPGDRLWVRETCRAHELSDKEAEEDTFGVIERLGLELPPYGLDGVVYHADGAFREIQNTREASDAWSGLNAYRSKRGATVPGIHMPRWASRITLAITGVRVERLHDISEADALAEGITQTADPDYFGVEGEHLGLNARESYAHLWAAINGQASVDANPWVWVVEFQR